MAVVVPDILAKIVEHKRAGLDTSAARRTLLEKRAQARPAARDFRAAITINLPAVIAEVKKASPSKGVFRADFNPVRTARQYEQGGAAAMSVLTDEEFFQGKAEDLIAAREAVSIPVLRKDFTIDETQVLEAAAMGADAILLIAAILEAKRMEQLAQLAHAHKMASLVEVHDDDDLGRALDSGAQIIGVNNRNLHTFEVKLETSLRLAERIPPGIVRVAESGIHFASDVHKLAAAGFSAFLVGEHLMLAGDPSAALRELRQA